MKNELYLLDLVKKHIQEQSDLNESGRRGLWKSEWNEEDQILAMFNALYGIEDLGISKEELMSDVIGSSLGSLAKQTANFKFLNGEPGLDRPHTKQSPVFEKYKNLSKSEFKRICSDIINNRMENPETAVVNKKIGNEIGSKRDEIDRSRREELLKKGINPDKQRLTMTGSRPKNLPVEDEPEAESLPEPSVTKQTEKDQIKDFINSIRDRLQNVNSKEDALTLANDLEFIIGYIDKELTDKNMVAEITNILKNRNVITESKVVSEFKRITGIMKKI